MFAMLGYMEIIAIVLAVLLLFGAKQLPKLARGLGESIREIKKVKREMDDEKVSDGGTH